MMTRTATPRLKHVMLCASLLALITAHSIGQTVRTCATMENHQIIIQQDPGAAAALAAIEAQTEEFVEAGVMPNDVLRRIPVVVHVVWNTPDQNISDAQVLSQIAVLNEDFRRLNADASNTPPSFAAVAADAEFEFCLAQRDPQGGATNGITRTQTNQFSFSSNNDGVKFSALGGRDAWPRDQYLNIWVCNLTGGLLGYAQFPGGPANTDGIVLLYQAFGRVGNVSPQFSRGRTTTHEVGHWLNLRHIWGDNQPFCGDDFVSDTPAADGPHYGCQIGVNSCGGTNMVQNYMDYSDDYCMNLFTQGQKLRMQALFAPGGARVALLSSPALCNTTPPPPPVGGPFQVNQPISSLLINNTSGSASTPAIVSVPVNTQVSLAFASSTPGAGYDTILSFGPAVTAATGGAQSQGGQFLNVGLTTPFVWLNSGTTNALIRPFPGNVTVGAVPSVAATFTLQNFVLTPTLSDGFAISQPCQLNSTSGGGSCTLNLPAGPTSDDGTVAVSLAGNGCTVPVNFYGTSYSTLFVASNGRVTFQQADGAFAPSVNAALTGRPFVGFWTDLNPAVAGSISISRPTSSRIRVAWNGVRYFGETVSNSFAIEFDSGTGAVILDGLNGIAPNPETQAYDPGQNQFLGLSRGAGATLSGTSFFAPGLTGSANATNMIFDFYDAASQFGGQCSSLVTSLNRITFTPSTSGGYNWTAN